ncbi:hypothetical protein HOY82DRAFT_54533 [Tuber indicum]|nr:hypothetical protein HOY82DRAFT_54533 [Tuber indicum]
MIRGPWCPTLHSPKPVVLTSLTIIFLQPTVGEIVFPHPIQNSTGLSVQVLGRSKSIRKYWHAIGLGNAKISRHFWNGQVLPVEDRGSTVVGEKRA